MNEKTIQVSKSGLDLLVRKLARLNRRAARLGVKPITVEVGPWADVSLDDGKVIRALATATVTLEMPVIPGCRFLATLEHTEAGNIIRKAPGTEEELDLSAYRTCGPRCEHCKAPRNRKDTFVIERADKSFFQIGRDCLLYYLPLGMTPEKAADLAEWVSLLTYFGSASGSGEGDNDEYMERGSREEERISTHLFLAYVSAVVEVHGFRSRKQADLLEQSSTKEDVLFNLFPGPNRPKDKIITPKPQHEEDATRIIEWLKSIEPKTDFDHNLRLIGNLPSITLRDTGIAAYAYAAFMKHLERQIEWAKKNAGRTNEYVGQVKERLRKFPLTFVGTPYSTDTQWGTLFIHKFSDEAGNDLVWKTSTGLNEDPGAKFVADFSVKAHEEYKNRKQTVVTRVKFHETPVDKVTNQDETAEVTK